MGVIQVSDELERLIEQQVAAGHAASAGAYVEEAVRQAIAQRDPLAGDVATIGTPAEAKQVLTDMMGDLLARFGTGRG